MIQRIILSLLVGIAMGLLFYDDATRIAVGFGLLFFVLAFYTYPLAVDAMKEK